MSKEDSIHFKSWMSPLEIADQLILEQTAIIEQHLPFALDNYDNMVKIVHTSG